MNGKEKKLVVDHIDNNNNNNEFNNLQLLCYSCNGKKNPRGKGKKLSPVYIRGDEYLGVREPSPEMKQNQRCEPIFRQWLEEMINKHEMLAFEDVLNGGAEKAGCSQASIYRYLQKVCSIEGKYMVIQGDSENRHVKYKPEFEVRRKSQEKKNQNPENIVHLDIKTTAAV